METVTQFPRQATQFQYLIFTTRLLSVLTHYSIMLLVVVELGVQATAVAVAEEVLPQLLQTTL
jgi:hypothetical protein